ncbi:hypothetical protein HYH02_004594 [Chlamydomonas schloesseri]|uniref:Neurotransmitter-gated ion-channel transmembrane domain-containing protein n=1 Tax=Chlamydomonas schloesseri TaxID=2026947 RepID=A0A836B8D0_9CHLO|nr:hypothetical protein HYH02_004594 [Chlamydomonas schloesseri]|eukprot:KAG2450757.1 hypothetical protein HYH02_004594 [Chlamydomonas schloesseri]
MKVVPVEGAVMEGDGRTDAADVPRGLAQLSTDSPTGGGDKAVRPSASPIRITLYVRTSIFTVSTIDTPGQSFTVTLYTCVAGPGLRPLLAAAGLEERFDPRLEWLESEVLEMTTKGWERVVRGDDLEWHFRARIKFAEQFELQRFPFDWQSLSLTLSCQHPAEWPMAEVAGYGNAFISTGGTPVLVRLQPVGGPTGSSSSSSSSGSVAKSKSGCEAGAGSAAGAGTSSSSSSSPREALIFFRDGFLLRSSWEYRGYSLQHWLSHPSLSGQGKQYSNLQSSLHFSRAATYYAYNILLPLWLLTSLGFCAFSLNVSDSTGDRLSLLVTLLLTAAAYKIVVSSALPLVSYLTRLDWYVLVAFGLLVVLTVETAAVATVADAGLREKLDWALAAGLGGAWGVFSLGFMAVAWLGGRDPHTGLRILEEDSKTRPSRVDFKVMAWAAARE